MLVNLNHFRLLRVVGKGAFGKVRIVERRDTGLTFALKYIRKDEGLFFYTKLGLGDGVDGGAKAGSWSSLIGPLIIASRSIGECSEYNTGEANVGAFKSPFPLQSPL